MTIPLEDRALTPWITLSFHPFVSHSMKSTRSLRSLLGSTISLIVLLSLTTPAAAARWKVLFDGSSTEAFRQFKQDGFPKRGWEVVDGTLHVKAGGGAGDLVTKEQFGDFELEFEWKVAPGANSGVMYRVSEDLKEPWQTGPEYQVLDDSRHGDGRNPKTSASALYALVAANPKKALKQVGEWNKARIVVRGWSVQHWLNGKKVVSIDLASPEARALIAQSKFSGYPKFAREPIGHLCFQDHGDDVWFRKIRVRSLDSK